MIAMDTIRLKLTMMDETLSVAYLCAHIQRIAICAGTTEDSGEARAADQELHDGRRGDDGDYYFRAIET